MPDEISRRIRQTDDINANGNSGIHLRMLRFDLAFVLAYNICEIETNISMFHIPINKGKNVDLRKSIFFHSNCNSSMLSYPRMQRQNKVHL